MLAAPLALHYSQRWVAEIGKKRVDMKGCSMSTQPSLEKVSA